VLRRGRRRPERPDGVRADLDGRDLFSGRQLMRFYGRLPMLVVRAAIVGPVIGGQLAAVTTWPGIIAFLSAVGAAILLACVLVFRGTLPADRRVTGGMAVTTAAASQRALAA
jgi:DHA1 family bicyclomycin/chloramphenicol resistance-like MFS transporter